VLKPAIGLAEQGIAVDWFLTLKAATNAKELARYPTTRDIWLPNGFPPVTAPGAPLERLKLKGLAATLKRLAAAGRRDFYEGEIAASIVKDMKAMGGVLGAQDLRNFHARIVDPLMVDYRGMQFALASGLTAGPSMQGALAGLGAKRGPPACWGRPSAPKPVRTASRGNPPSGDRRSAHGNCADPGRRERRPSLSCP